MLAQFYAPIVGGEERMTESLAGALVRRGHDVAVATLRQPGQDRYEERDGVRVHRLPGLAQRVAGLFSEDGRRHAPPVPDPETVLALRRVIARERPDVVHGHNWLSIAYLPLRRRTGPPTCSPSTTTASSARTRCCSAPGRPVVAPPAQMRGCAANQYGAVVGPPVALFTASGLGAAPRGRPVAPGQPRGRPSAGLIAVRPRSGGAELRRRSGRRRPPERRRAGLPEEHFILFVGDVTAARGSAC